MKVIHKSVFLYLFNNNNNRQIVIKAYIYSGLILIAVNSRFDGARHFILTAHFSIQVLIK